MIEVTLTHSDVHDAVLDWLLRNKKGDVIRGSGLMTTRFYATEYHAGTKEARIEVRVVHEPYSAQRAKDGAT